MLFDFATLTSNDRYKLLAATIVPRPIAWMVTQGPAGRNAAPFSFFNVFSSDPPLVCLGIGPRADGSPKDTTVNLRANGEFVLHLVGEDQAAAMNVTGTELPPGVDEIAAAGLATIPSTKVTPPRLAAAAVALEGAMMQEIALEGGRTLVLGRILAMHVRDDAVLDAGRCHIDTPSLGLIGRMHGGGFYARTTDLFEMRRLRPDEVLPA